MTATTEKDIDTESEKPDATTEKVDLVKAA